MKLDDHVRALAREDSRGSVRSLEAEELLFLLWSRALGVTWSPEPHLRARQRAAFAVMMAERKISEAFARMAVIETYQAELREVLREVDEWSERAELAADAVARTRTRSPWRAPGADEERPPRWVLDGLGRWRDTWRDRGWVDEVEEDSST